jgi:hypothetical protein
MDVVARSHVPADSYVSLDYQEQTGKILRKKCSGSKRPKCRNKGEPWRWELRAFVDCVRNRSSRGERRTCRVAPEVAVAICQSIRRGQT